MRGQLGRRCRQRRERVGGCRAGRATSSHVATPRARVCPALDPQVQYLGKAAQFTGEQLMGMLLVDLKSIGEGEGVPVSECVLSVPTYFTEPERHAMLAAAQVAGLNCLRLLNETTATALSYGIYKTDLPDGDPVNVVFVDVGFSSTQVGGGGWGEGLGWVGGGARQGRGAVGWRAALQAWPTAARCVWQEPHSERRAAPAAACRCAWWR